MGGLPGLMLTLEANNALQQQSKKISLLGPRGINEFMASIRPFTHRNYNSKELDFTFNEINSTFKDENVEISFIKTSQSCKKRRYNSTLEKTYLSFIVKGPKVKQRFDKGKLKEFKVSKPDHFKKLSTDQSVTLEDGSLVHPSDVLQPRKPRDVFLILDVTNDCLEDFIENFKNPANQILNSKDEKLQVIFHMVQDDLLFENQIYQDWIKSWGNDVKVFLLNNEIACCDESILLCFKVDYN